MTPEDIERIEALGQRAEALPAELFSPSDPAAGPDIPAQRAARLEAAQRTVRNARQLTFEAEAYLSALFGADSKYVKALAALKFDDTQLESQNRAGRAGVTWSAETKKLRELLAKAKIEGGVKARIQSRESSWRTFLASGTAKAIFLGAVVSAAAAFFSKDAITGWFGGLRWGRLGGAFPSIEVVEHERIVDLREWTPTPPGDTTSQTGKATFISNLKLRKIRDEGTEFCMTAASSGSVPVFTSSTHRVAQHPIDMKLVGWPNLEKQVLAVLEIPPETKGDTTFSANLNSVRYRGFSDEHAQWCSLGVWHPTRKLTMVVKFPPGKMGRAFLFKTAFFYDRSNFAVLTPDAAHCVIDANSVTWTVDYPVLGNAYRVDWNW